VLSWGRNDYGQLGHGDFENCGRPKHLKFFEEFKIKCVSAGWNHSAFVTGFYRIKFETSDCYVLLFDIESFQYFITPF
jgi:Regulator of chromosome condensation (RCC1) repeat